MNREEKAWKAVDDNFKAVADALEEVERVQRAVLFLLCKYTDLTPEECEDQLERQRKAAGKPSPEERAAAIRQVRAAFTIIPSSQDKTE